jgi:hypothetical protein
LVLNEPIYSPEKPVYKRTKLSTVFEVTERETSVQPHNSRQEQPPADAESPSFSKVPPEDVESSALSKVPPEDAESSASSKVPPESPRADRSTVEVEADPGQVVEAEGRGKRKRKPTAKAILSSQSQSRHRTEDENDKPRGAEPDWNSISTVFGDICIYPLMDKISYKNLPEANFLKLA